MAEWFEDESFWESLFPFLFSAERLAAAAGEVDRLLELLDFEGRDVLDLCCGPGRHAVELARRGYCVTGVDRSAFLLARAEAHAKATGVAVDWLRFDMRDFVRPAAFDLVINMFTSFGYFDDPEDDLRVLRSIRASLRDGGRVVIDMIGKEHLAEIFQPTMADDADGGALLVRRQEVFDDWSRIRNEWTLIREGSIRSFSFHHNLYSARELKDRLAAAGFRDIAAFGDLDGSAYGRGAERLVVVGAV